MKHKVTKWEESKEFLLIEPNSLMNSWVAHCTRCKARLDPRSFLIGTSWSFRATWTSAPGTVEIGWGQGWPGLSPKLKNGWINSMNYEYISYAA